MGIKFETQNKTGRIICLVQSTVCLPVGVVYRIKCIVGFYRVIEALVCVFIIQGSKNITLVTLKSNWGVCRVDKKYTR